MDEPRTFAAQLAVASARLTHAGVDRPAREARHLLQHVTGLSGAGLISAEKKPLDDTARTRFFDLIERRASGEPYEYLTGEAWFYGLAFACSHDTLIPRADSETVVDEALARLPLGRPSRIADLGCGTGCLLVALLKNHAGVSGIGIERSPEAAVIARQNLEHHGLQDRAGIETASWADWSGWGEADLIISNPPYIRADIIPTLDESVRAFEPHAALDGGDDGLAAYREIIDRAARQMKPDAWLVFEIGFDQREAVIAMLDVAGFSSLSCQQDMGQRDRAVCARR